MTTQELKARIRQLEADARESALQYLSDTGRMADKVDALTAELARNKDVVYSAILVNHDNIHGNGLEGFRTNRDRLRSAVNALAEWAATKEAGNE